MTKARPRAGMGRRASTSWDETDLKARHWYCYLGKAGACRYIKNKAIRRDRRQARRDIRRELAEL